VVWPDVLPDGKTVITTVWNNGSWDEAKIVAYPLGTGEPRLLIDGGSAARYVSTGHLLYMRNGNLYAAPFDAVKLRLLGPAVPVVNGVAGSSVPMAVLPAGTASGEHLHARLALDRGVVGAVGRRLRGRSGGCVGDLRWWEGERLVGFLGFYGYGSTLELAGMVSPDARRHGIATAMLDAAAPLTDEPPLLPQPAATSASGSRTTYFTAPSPYQPPASAGRTATRCR